MVKLKTMKDMAGEIENGEEMAAEFKATAKAAAAPGKRKRGKTIEDDDDDFVGDEESESVPRKVAKGNSSKRKIEPLLFKSGVSTKSTIPTKVFNF